MVKWVRVLKKQEKRNREGVGGERGKWVRVCRGVGAAGANLAL